MNVSIHYYILSLGNKTSRLYEGFRDELIDIQNSEFPYYALKNDALVNPSTAADLQLRDFIYKTDMHFSHYYEQDPLRLIVVGSSSNLAIFRSLTVHNDVIIGTVEGDYSSTSARDLGKIVWPVIKAAMCGASEIALRALAEADAKNNLISGITAVWLSAIDHPGSTLYVEEDYHLKSPVPESDDVPDLGPLIHLWEVFNDIVDVIIEKVLSSGGVVIFLESGMLFNRQRIALVPRS